MDTPVIGRPRGFDTEAALERAVEVFWRQGYEGASLADLTTAMGINKTSMYAAFGNKRELFDKALERYARVDMAYAGRALAEPTARRVAETFLRENVKAITTPGKPPGCLSIQGGLSCGPENSDVCATLAASRKGGELAMRDRFRRAAEEGDLAPGADPDRLARYLMAVSEGLAVHAAAGSGREELAAVAEIALRAFPG